MYNLIEKRIEENNVKIKNLRVNRNINFRKTAFCISNTICTNIVVNECGHKAFDNKLMWIPTSLLLLSYGANILYFGNLFVELIDNTKNINRLKKIKKDLQKQNEQFKKQNEHEQKQKVKK